MLASSRNRAMGDFLGWLRQGRSQRHAPVGRLFVVVAALLWAGAASGDGAPAVTISAGAVDGVPDVFSVARHGANLEVRVNGTLVLEDPLSGVPSVVINGSADNDELIVDFVDGNPIPSGGVNFTGGLQTGAPGDSLTVVNTAPFTSQTFNFTGTSGSGKNGSVTINDGVDTRTITYTGLEPISGGPAADVTFSLPLASVNNATLRDYAAVAGRIEIHDNGATFEDINVPTSPTVPAHCPCSAGRNPRLAPVIRRVGCTERSPVRPLLLTQSDVDSSAPSKRTGRRGLFMNLTSAPYPLELI